MRLQLTREGDYAVRAMLGLAARKADTTVSSRLIAEEWEIPPRFLVQVLRKLARYGLVESVVGRNGGYRLARRADRITLLDVVAAIDELPESPLCVLRGGPCRPDGRCLVHDAFSAARDQFLKELAARTLSGVLGSSGWRPTIGPFELSESRDWQPRI